MKMEHNIHIKIKQNGKRLIFDFLYFVLCSLELPKPEPNMFIKMPGRKRLQFGRLKEIAFQIRFW